MSSLCMRIGILSLGALLAAGFASGTAMAQPAPAPSGVAVVEIPGVGQARVISYRAQVVSTDPARRRVVLQGASGKRWSVLAPPLVGDISRLRTGETLLIRSLPGVAKSLGKAQQGTPREVLSEVAIEAGLPGWPQDFGLREVTITTILVNIDKASGTLSFEGPDGQVRTIKAGNPQVLNDLANVQLGDLCQITYIEGLAVNALN